MEFRELFKRIEDYHGALGQRRAYDTLEQRMASVRNQSLAVMMELAELVDSVPWKPWRDMDLKDLDVNNAAREVIDIIFFLVGICEDLQITSENLEVMFEQVMANNIKRLKNGYSKLDFARGGDVNG